VWLTGDGVWHAASGICTPPHTAARGEVEALLHVCLWAVGDCWVMVDCESVVYGFQAIRRGGPCYQKLLRGPCGDLWKRFPITQHNIQVKWIPSHLTAGQWVQRGGPLPDWEGNDRADQEAKKAARTIEPPGWLVQRRRQQLEKEKMAIHMIAEIHFKVLAGRVRVKHGDVAAKARKRKVPALPAALKEKTQKGEAHQVGGGKAGRTRMSEFAWNGMRRFLSAEQAAELVLRPKGMAPEGCHQLGGAAGPYKEWGTWEKPKSGGVRWLMGCAKCGNKAHDSSRWGELMRTACGVPALNWYSEHHDLASMAGSTLHECSRCGLQCPHDHAATTARSKCPVQVASLAGNPRPEATRWQGK
jgi:hypothetical protein